MLQIALISNQHDHNVRISVVPQLLQPSCDILEGVVLEYVRETGCNDTHDPEVLPADAVRAP